MITMGRTIEQMIADGMTVAEIHREVKRLTREKEAAEEAARQEEAKRKREQEEAKKNRQEAREKAAIAVINWMIAEDLITVDEADREYINDFVTMLNEAAFTIRQEKQIVDLMKKLR